MNHFRHAGALCLLLAAGTAAVAQTAPLAPAPYVGPSTVVAATVRQLQADPKDDQRVRMHGRIVSHDGGDHYTFADETGPLKVEISTKRFPPGPPIGAEQRVEVIVEVDKDLFKTEFEVKELRRLP